MNTVDVLIREMDDVADRLYRFLLSCGVKPETKTLYGMIRDLDKIVAIRKDKSYIGVTTDSDGIINKVAEIDGILQKQELPADILRGYYRYENGNYVLDEALRQKIWR